MRTRFGIRHCPATRPKTKERHASNTSSESLTATGADLGMGASWPGGGPHRGASVFCIVVKLRMRARTWRSRSASSSITADSDQADSAITLQVISLEEALADKLKCLLQRHMSKRSG